MEDEEIPISRATPLLSGELQSLKRQMIAAFVFSFIANALLLTSPLFMLLVYDRVLSSRSTETLISLLIVVAVLLTVMCLLDYARRRMLARIGASMQQQLEDRVYSIAYRSPHLLADERGNRAVMSDLDNVRKFFNSGAPIALFDALATPIFLGVVFMFHHYIGWLGTIGVCVLALVIYFGERAVEEKRATSASSSQKSTQVSQALKNSLGSLRNQGMSVSLRKRWLIARNNARGNSIELNDHRVWFSVVSKAMRLGLLSCVLATGAYLVLQAKITVGVMIACSVMLNRVFVPVESFMKQLTLTRKSWEHWKSLKQTLEMPHEEEPLNARARLSRFSLHDVSVVSEYSDNELLRNLSIEVQPGEAIQISGPTGSGKSVFAQTLRGNFPLKNGEIRLDGEKIEHFTEEDVDQFFGLVPQQIVFFPGTIEQNISCLDLDATSKDVIAAARKVKTHRFIRNLPDGYKTRIDAEGSKFSEGQRQQFALARALYKQPRVLIIDSPDGVLARLFGADLSELIKMFTDEGNSIIFLTREKRRMQHMSQHLFLKNGYLEIIERENDNVANIKGGISLARPELVAPNQ